MSKKLLNLLLVIMMLVVLVPTALAAPPAQGQEYVVTAGDWLSKLADKYLGNPLTYQAIVIATKKKHAEDPSFAEIVDPDLIEPGWKLWIPSAEEAEAILATLTPVLVLAAPTPAPTPVYGEVEGTYDAKFYTVTDTIKVKPGSMLTITEGVTFRFKQGTSLIIPETAKLVVKGKEDAPVKFMAADRGSAGWWGASGLSVAVAARWIGAPL